MECSCKKKIKEEKCDICDLNLCISCYLKSVEIKDWKYEFSNRCYMCSRKGCKKCLETCHDCWCSLSGYPMLCKDCSNLHVKCIIHNWKTCGLHNNNCGECSKKIFDNFVKN